MAVVHVYVGLGGIPWRWYGLGIVVLGVPDVSQVGPKTDMHVIKNVN